MSCGQKCLSFSTQAKPLPAFAIKPSHKANFPLSKTDSMKEGFLLTVSSWGCHRRSCQRRPELRGLFLQLVFLTQPAKPPWEKKKKRKKRRRRKKETPEGIVGCKGWWRKNCSLQSPSQDLTVNHRVMLLRLFSKPQLWPVLPNFFEALGEAIIIKRDMVESRRRTLPYGDKETTLQCSLRAVCISFRT